MSDGWVQSLRATALSRNVRSVARRVSWGLGDQAVSSLTNFAVGIYVARSLDLADFGIFTLAWVTYGVVLNISRGLATDPLAVRFSAAPVEAWRGAVARASGTALLVGLVTGVAVALAGAGIGGAVGGSFVALGLILPAVLLQDSWRYAFFAAGQGRKAFTNDLVWAAALIPAMLVAAQYGSVVGFVLAWGLSGAAAAAFGCVQVRLVPQLAAARAWVYRHRDLGPRYLVENVSLSGASQLRMYGLGAIAGLAAVGTFRGAELLMGPFLTLMMGLGLFAVPEAARVLQRSPRRLPQFCLLLGGTQASGALVWGLGLLFLLPDPAGRFVLGAVWVSASALIVPATLSVMNASLQIGAFAGLRALGASRRSMRAQLLTAGATVAGGLAGAAVGGALGSAWGVALARTLVAVVWWWQLRAGLRDLPMQPAATSSAPTAQLDREEARIP